MQNYRERLFQLIRKEEVVVFLGAGVSIYAGFPSGEKLREKIYDSLTVAEKEEIPERLNLAELTEQIVRLRNGSRNSLIQILTKTFLKEPCTFPFVHQKLASIPHIKTIITTNYDRLLEKTYKDECSVIISDKQIPYMDQKKAEVFKIHGDLSDPESIIISQSDYNSFFRNNTEQTIYWSLIKERLATKTVLFLGYNLEDPNVENAFDQIMEGFKENKRENFFISPSIPTSKKNHLVTKGITCIEDSAENLVIDLYQNIKENITTDFVNEEVKVDTFYRFLNKMNLLPDLVAGPKGLKLKSVRGIKEPLQGTLNITFKEGTVLAKDFLDFSNGKRFGKFELSSKDLENIRLSWGELKMPDLNGDFKIQFIDKPKIETSVDLRFEDGYQFNHFPVKVYGSPYKIEIHTILPYIDLILEIKADSFPNPICNFTYQHKATCSKIQDEIQLHEFLWRLSSEMKLSIFKDSKKIGEHQSPKAEELKESAKFYLNYFRNLEIIEKHFNIQFTRIDFNQITNKLDKTVKNIVEIIKNGYFEIRMENPALLEFTSTTSDTISSLEELNSDGNTFQYDEGQIEIISLHGIELNLGIKQIEILDPYVVNIPEMKQKKHDYALLESKMHKARIKYI